MDLVRIREMATENEDENWEFRRFLKSECRLNPKQLDAEVVQIAERVWAGIDCGDCANCCRELRPSFGEEDIERLARRFSMTRPAIIEKYMQASEEDDDVPWQIRSQPCPFLDGNLCTIYEDRPPDCRGYPYLKEPDFAGRTIGMIERTSTCPIVYDVMEQLKEAVGFRWKKRT